MKTYLLPLLLALGVASGCITEQRQKEYTDLVRRVEQEITLAAHTGFLPGNAPAQLAESQTAYADGDLDKAYALAQTALAEAVAAQVKAREAAREKAGRAR